MEEAGAVEVLFVRCWRNEPMVSRDSVVDLERLICFREVLTVMGGFALHSPHQLGFFLILERRECVYVSSVSVYFRGNTTAVPNSPSPSSSMTTYAPQGFSAVYMTS